MTEATVQSTIPPCPDWCEKRPGNGYQTFGGRPDLLYREHTCESVSIIDGDVEIFGEVSTYEGAEIPEPAGIRLKASSGRFDAHEVRVIARTLLRFADRLDLIEDPEA